MYLYHENHARIYFMLPTNEVSNRGSLKNIYISDLVLCYQVALLSFIEDKKKPLSAKKYIVANCVTLV